MSTGWIVFWSIIGLLAFLLVSPVRISLAVTNNDFSLTLRYLLFRYHIDQDQLEKMQAEKDAPAKKKKKKKEPDAATAAEKAAKKEKNMQAIKGSLRQLWESLKKAGNALRRHILLDRILICVRVGGEDAAQTAQSFRKISSAVWIALGQIGAFCTMKAPKVFILPDFTGRPSAFDVSLRVGMRPLFALTAAAAFLITYLKELQKQKTNLNVKGGKKYESTSAHP
jgi:hypothetical protein